MLRRSSSSIATLAIVLALATVSESPLFVRQAVAQSSPAAPASVPAGTTVRIAGTSSMAALNEALKQKFESQFAGSKVEVQQNNADADLQAVQQGQVDLAAIGRPLTPEEKAAGLVQTPATRRKIAIVVGDKNSFPGDLTGEQFAQIFRGEITNWSQLGGANKPIRFLDRPASDTRLALQPYPVFESAPFQAGPNTVSIADENVDAMLQQLGDDGIGYAIFDQVVNRPGVKIVTLYGTPPSDPNYAFSQALTYVYRGPANPSVQAFLGYIAAPENQPLLAAAGAAAVGAAQSGGAASPAPEAAGQAPQGQDQTSPSPEAGQAPDQAQQTNPDGSAQAGTERFGPPWWLWLLAIPVIGALLWILFKGLGGSESPLESAQGPLATDLLAADRAGDHSRVILVPRHAHEAYAYWEVPESHKQRIRKDEGGRQLALRLHDVTGIDLANQPAHRVEQFDCEEFDQDMHLPIPESDRDYLVELGYVTHQGRWIKLAQSDAVRIPSSDFEQTSSQTPGFEPPTQLASDFEPAPPFESQSATDPMAASDSPIPVPTFPRLQEPFRSGGIPLIDPRPLVEPPAAESPTEPLAESSTELSVGPSAEPSVEPLTELSAEPLVESPTSPPVELPTEPPTEPLPSASTASAPTTSEDPSAAGQRAARVRRSQIALDAQGGLDVYAYWEVLDQHKEIAKQYGGETFILRICDVTGVDLNREAPHSVRQFTCEEIDRDRHVIVPSAGEYMAEIGYLAKNGRWLRIARSPSITVPAPNSAT